MHPCPVLTIAHLSDSHFGAYDGAAHRTRRVLDHVDALDPRPDVVLLTGDIADHGAPQEYRQVRAMLDERVGGAPLLLCPGNHDVRAAYGEILRDLPADRGDDPINEAHLIGGVKFCMLDSLVAAPPGERIDHGQLGPDSLEWLDDELASGETAFVCLHHPPVDVHIDVMDPIGLRDADQLEAVLRRHDNVVATLAGHAHTACAMTFAGRPLLLPGGLVSTVTLDAEPLPEFTGELPPMFAVHFVDDGSTDSGVVTHWRALPDR
ncbi:3',5'-cyclic adenosine monophosphate phosphodiesterase CpdA [Flexivirga endophytica]|uniref:3',5'-cyclic adenosine monophosphate phosphodiesterase CpdA n=1 Tax=Flexivirga endophytica TaxID=1849103 RepID=A0A916T1L6_9MICO|nr:3',5'-cyclic adenosine monophosphate phosphodiesterase CpdA [Flexivirga endophytica]GHB61594.1 3',5'-cyclic adenosine monophosphate phosphodiesterase CpdA [Flexivirga endophytica]